MRDWIRERAAWEPDDTVEEELLAASYKPHGEGVALEPKEKLKERIQRSPDRADALALAISGHDGGAQLADSFSAAPTRDDLPPPREEESWVPASPW